MRHQKRPNGHERRTTRKGLKSLVNTTIGPKGQRNKQIGMNKGRTAKNNNK